MFQVNYLTGVRKILIFKYTILNILEYKDRRQPRRSIGHTHKFRSARSKSMLHGCRWASPNKLSSAVTLEEKYKNSSNIKAIESFSLLVFALRFEIPAVVSLTTSSLVSVAIIEANTRQKDQDNQQQELLPFESHRSTQEGFQKVQPSFHD